MVAHSLLIWLVWLASVPVLSSAVDRLKLSKKHVLESFLVHSNIQSFDDLAEDQQHQRHLQDPDFPSWFFRYREIFRKSGLKRCLFLNGVDFPIDAQTGGDCPTDVGTEDYNCMFGEKTCFSDVVPKSSTHPQRRCMCDIDTGKYTCEEQWPPCDEVLGTVKICTDKIPMGAFRPTDGCEKYLECFYNLPSVDDATCCDGSSAQNVKCSCTPNKEFVCGLVANPCAGVKCGAAVKKTPSPSAAPTTTPPRPTQGPAESTKLLPPSTVLELPLTETFDDVDAPRTMTCPPNDPFGSSIVCGTNLTCSYGTESCCGQEYPSLLCSCEQDTPFACLNTDSCLFPQCQGNCPDVNPVHGATCNSTLFSGWFELGADGNVSDGSCRYNETSCSCPNTPGIGLDCQCLNDAWECSEIRCDTCSITLDISTSESTDRGFTSSESVPGPAEKPGCPEESPSTGDTCSSTPDFASQCHYDKIDCCGTTAVATACICDGGTWNCTSPSCPSPCPSMPICPPDDAIVLSCDRSMNLECDVGVKMCMDDPCSPNPQLVPSGPEFSCSCYEGEWGCGGTGCGLVFCGAREGESCGGYFGTPCERGLVCVDDPTDACRGDDCGGLCVNNTCPQGPLVQYKGTPSSCPVVVYTCEEGLESFDSEQCGCGCKAPTLTECPLEGVPPPGTPCSFIGGECQYDETCCPDGFCVNETFAMCDFPGMMSPIGKQKVNCAFDFPIQDDFPFEINGTECTTDTTAGEGCCGQPAYNCSCENNIYTCISLFAGIDCLCVEEPLVLEPPEFLFCPDELPNDGDSCTDPGFFIPCNYGELDCCGTFVVENACFCDKETETWSCSDPPVCPSPCPVEPVCPPEDAVVLNCTAEAESMECEIGELMCFDDICSDNPQMVPNGPISTCSCEEGGFWGCFSLPCALQLCLSKVGEPCGPSDPPCEFGLECLPDPTCSGPDCKDVCQAVADVAPPDLPTCPTGPDAPVGECKQDFDLITPCFYDEVNCCGTTIAGTSCSCEGGMWACDSVLATCQSPCPADPQCPPQDSIVIECTEGLSCDYGDLQCLDDPCGENPTLISTGPATVCSCEGEIWGCIGKEGCPLFEC